MKWFNTPQYNGYQFMLDTNNSKVSIVKVSQYQNTKYIHQFDEKPIPLEKAQHCMFSRDKIELPDSARS